MYFFSVTKKATLNAQDLRKRAKNQTFGQVLDLNLNEIVRPVWDRSNLHIIQKNSFVPISDMIP